jgi:hypothetical protein
VTIVTKPRTFRIGETMNVNSDVGLNWVVRNECFTIFGMSGFVEGDDWHVPTDFGTLGATDRRPVSGTILDLLENNVQKHRIAYIGLAPLAALFLALEGLLTVNHLLASQETVDRITCIVALDGIERKLVILRDLTHEMAAFDQDGEIIH